MMFQPTIGEMLNPFHSGCIGYHQTPGAMIDIAFDDIAFLKEEDDYAIEWSEDRCFPSHGICKGLHWDDFIVLFMDGWHLETTRGRKSTRVQAMDDGRRLLAVDLFSSWVASTCNENLKSCFENSDWLRTIEDQIRSNFPTDWQGDMSRRGNVGMICDGILDDIDFPNWLDYCVPLSHTQYQIESAWEEFSKVNKKCLDHTCVPGASPEQVLEKSTASPKRVGSVYLMQTDIHEFTKIGFSVEPRKREKTLQAEDPGLHLVAEFPNLSMKEEKDLHSQYADRRQRGEWFFLLPEDIERIKQQFKTA